MNSCTKYLFSCIGFTAATALVGAAFVARAAGNNSTGTAELTAFTSAPLCFEARASQQNGSAGFIARGVECSVLLAPDEADIILGKTADDSIPHQPKSAREVHLQLVGANAQAQMSGRDRMTATANYFVGNDPSKWKSGVPLFSRVQVSDVYPGMQLVYYANQSAQLEYDFLVQPEAHPEQIRFRVQGADEVRVDAEGNLVLRIDGQEICQHEPVVYQERGGTRSQIAASYRLDHDGTVGFALAAYDHSQPLVIDPVLDFLTYIGGQKLTIAWGIAFHGSNIYVAGETLSKNLPTNNPIVFTNNPGMQTNFSRFQGGTAGFGDAFIASYTTNGTLNYFSYIGGKGADGALAIAAAPDDSIWITGFTDSKEFPITNGILSTNIPGTSVLDPNDSYSSLVGPNNNARAVFPADAFIAHVSAGGTNLLFSTYFGGDLIDEGTAITLDANTNVFLAGLTSSISNFPVSANAFQPTNRGGFDAFVAEFSPTNPGVSASGYTNTYSSYFGGTNLDYALGIALDSSDNIWIAGITFSTNFYWTNTDELSNRFATTLPNGIETNHIFNGLNSQTNSPHHNTAFHGDGFVTEFSTDGKVPFSTLLGGTNDDVAVKLAIDGSDNVFVTGYTLSRNFPTNVATGLVFTNVTTDTNFPNGTTNIYIGASTNFISRAFVTELVLGTSNIFSHYIAASTILGGDGADRATDIALDANGNVYVIGSAGSTNFFATNVAVLTNLDFTTLNTNRHGVFTNFTGVGFVTNNFTFTNLTSTNFVRRLQRSSANTNDIFIAVLGPGLTNYVESIILGGPGDNEPNSMALDANSGVIYFVGDTTSKTNFATTNALQPVFPRGARPAGFVGRINGLFPFP